MFPAFFEYKRVVDIVIVITYPINEPEKWSVKTNAKAEAMGALLGTYLQDQIGRGADEHPPAQRDTYTVRIGLRLEDDAWITQHDCGNHGLATGIVMDCLKRWGTKPVELQDLD